MRTTTLLACALLSVVATSCKEFDDPPPASPTVAPIPPSQFAIAGRWDGTSNQGRPVRFDVDEATRVVDGSLTLHHDCSGGRLVLPLAGFEAQVSGDSFSSTINWRVDEGTKYYVGKLTVSGRFEGAHRARGGFVNSVTDKQADNLGVCPSASGSWEASRN
jgi:hypothetical protein